MKNSRCAAAFQPDILWAQVMIFSEWNMQPTNAQKYPSRNRPKCVCSKRLWTNSKGRGGIGGGKKKASMVRIQNFCLEKREEALDSRGQDGEFNLCSGSNCPTELGNTHCTNNGASKSINPSSSRANFHKRASHKCSGRKRVNMLPWRGAN